MLQKWCQEGPRDPLLEAQNQKVAKLGGAIWRPDGVPSLLGAKSGPKIAPGPQICRKSSKHKPTFMKKSLPEMSKSDKIHQNQIRTFSSRRVRSKSLKARGGGDAP